jgi:CBS domain-containing protein
MKISEIMHKGVECVEPDASIITVAQKMRDHDIGAIPICADGKAIGMVTDRDLTVRVLAESKDASKLTAKDVMTRDFIFCMDSEEVEDAIRIMEAKKIRRLPVLDDAKQLVGMISLGDISHALSRDLAGEVTKAVSAHHA